ncbi:ALF repeat-containing protein [Streptomyces sp. M2CJ-2]|uniref:ALF repeat-containing protein n=1 Tax=Streptomyces sp. M2CJ-2 TaxID=2803948 RepID=UPI001927A9A0|nr:ALF repeat-containing protein [Streptomyces sp. M2CJ-2]MBL3671486.1 ALF repeat-containing protein [Streptomyces sp. M2CJ-2]
MRPTRAALLVVATALTPALLFTTPAFATGSTATSTTVTATSETPVDEMSEEELRIAILRILADEDSGMAVVREANRALDDGSPEALRAFLETGYRLAQAEDDRVAIFRILHLANQNGDKAVIREVNKVLDDGSPEALRAFLETGYRLAQAEDDRVAIFRILADLTISDALRAAAEEAIDGTPEELRYFLEVGQYEVDG